MKQNPLSPENLSKEEIKKLLFNNHVEPSFNPNPERYLSRSLSQTKLNKYFQCPKCFFEKKEDEKENPPAMISSSIHLIADFLLRNKNEFPTSMEVLDFINFSDGNFLERLKTDEENNHYDILRFLVDIEDPKIRNQIISGALIVYGASKRLGFLEVRKRDSISLNLKHKKNLASTTLYTNPDYTGRHKTIFERTNRRYDNFLIDYKLNFSKEEKNNALQMAFYYLTHTLSNRNIHHYYILDISSGNLFSLNKIDVNIFLKIIDNFLTLKNLNFRGENPSHLHIFKEDNSQTNFFEELNTIDFGSSFGSKTYKETLSLIKKLEESLNFNDLGQIVSEKELNKIYSKYPIKFD